MGVPAATQKSGGLCGLSKSTGREWSTDSDHCGDDSPRWVGSIWLLLLMLPLQDSSGRPGCKSDCSVNAYALSTSIGETNIESGKLEISMVNVAMRGLLGRSSGFTCNGR